MQGERNRFKHKLFRNNISTMISVFTNVSSPRNNSSPEFEQNCMRYGIEETNMVSLIYNLRTTASPWHTWNHGYRLAWQFGKCILQRTYAGSGNNSMLKKSNNVEICASKFWSDSCGSAVYIGHTSTIWLLVSEALMELLAFCAVRHNNIW